MKQIWFAVCLLTGSLLTPAIASAEPILYVVVPYRGQHGEELSGGSGPPTAF